MGSQHVLRMRGLPFGASDSDITHFFSPFAVEDIRICKKSGEPRSSLVQCPPSPSGRGEVDRAQTQVSLCRASNGRGVRTVQHREALQ